MNAIEQLPELSELRAKDAKELSSISESIILFASTKSLTWSALAGRIRTATSRNLLGVSERASAALPKSVIKSVLLKPFKGAKRA